MTDAINEIVGHFAALLARRLQGGVFTTEDSVRYTFFISLLEQGCIRPEEIVLEMPHPAIPNAKIDTWLFDWSGRPLAMEFKYDRVIPSERNSPRTQKAGKVFNDLRRLTMVEARGVFVYLADAEMHSYLSNPANGLADFYSLSPDECMHIDASYLTSKIMTFQKVAGGSFDCTIKCINASSLPREYNLRVYETNLEMEAPSA